MKKTILLASLNLMASAMSVAHPTSIIRSPSVIVKEAPAAHWRSIDNDNTLYIKLDSGTVVVELNPLLAPNHVKQLKTLARSGFYDGLNFYRFVEGFVAQAGDLSESKPIGQALKSLKSERIHFTKQPLNMTVVDPNDSYGATTGFINGFSVATNQQQSQYWQTHCPGAFAMARDNNPDSASTEFYVVIGQAPRYLDRNLTVFGQVRQGFEHLQTLKRRPETNGSTNIMDNQIISIKVASDLPLKDQVKLKIMTTLSSSFVELIQSRMNRPETFFIERANYVDICGVTVPTK